MSHAALLISLTPTKSSEQCPYELQYGTKPNITAMIPAPFGEQCIIKNFNQQYSEFLSTPGITGVYIGLSRRSKSHCVWICDTNRVRESNQVIFPSQMGEYSPVVGESWSLPAEQFISGTDDIHSSSSDTDDDELHPPEPTAHTDSIVIYDAEIENIADKESDNTDKISNSIDSTEHAEVSTDTDVADNSTNPADGIDTEVDGDTIDLAKHFAWARIENADKNAALTSFFKETHSMDFQTTDVYDDHINFALSTVVIYEDYRKAKMDPKWETRWKPAHETEMKAMLENGVFDMIRVTDIPPRTNIVDSKMIYAEKYDSDGSIAKWKARLVAKGFTQRHGIDFFESFAPTPMNSVWRILLTIASCFKCRVKHFDISTAFLTGDLNEKIYMRMPAGMRPRDDNNVEYVALLNSPIYGLRQSARQFYEKLNDVLTKNGYNRSTHEPCLYMKGNTYLMVYVDDILVVSANDTETDSVKRVLSENFKITGGDDVKTFLGMKISQSKDGTTFEVSQQQLIEDLAEKFPSIRGSRPVKTPIPANTQFNKQHCVADTDREYDRIMHSQYRQIVGALLYLAGKTRSDLQYAISKASTVMSSPGPQHFELLWHIFRYTYHSRELKMHVKAIFTGDVVLECETDSDWARDKDTRKSTSGYVTCINGCVTAAKTKTQTSVSQSSAEAEMIAATLACKDIVHQRRLLAEMGFPQVTPTLLKCDSKSVIDSANNPMVGSKLKHVQIGDFWCRELIDRNIIRFQKVSGLDNLADMFTKPLVGQAFHKWRAALGIG